MDDLIKHMVDRFLTWRLPNDFSPDAGISFKAEFNEDTALPMKHEPVGTNLLDATQAEAMVRHMLTPPPGYALVKLEGAEERVAHIVEAGVDLQSGHQAIAREIIRAMTEEK